LQIHDVTDAGDYDPARVGYASLDGSGVGVHIGYVCRARDYQCWHMNLTQARQCRFGAQQMLVMSHVLWMRPQKRQKPPARGIVPGCDQVLVLRPFGDSASDVALVE